MTTTRAPGMAAEVIAVRPGPPLTGSVTVDGSKNAALPLLAAAAALGRPVRLSNIPANTDVQIMLSLLQESGWHVARPVGEPATVVILPSESRHTHPGLPQAARIRAWQPLGMDSTRFGPLPDEIAARCAPTELDQDTDTHLKGTAHDFSARLLGGVCGIAGAFTVLDDLAALLRYMLDTSTAPKRARFGPAWSATSLTVQTGTLTPPRGLFWHSAPETAPANDVWVHYGFTGTGMWISPRQRRWAVLLTNKLYYTRDRQPLTDIRNAFRELALI